MVSPKPFFGYEDDLNFIPYNPSTEELDRLVASIEEIAGLRANAKFKKRLFRLLTLYRRTRDMATTVPRPKNIRVELTVLKKEMVKLYGLLPADAKGLSGHARRILFELMIGKEPFFDPLTDLAVALKNAADLVEEALKNETLSPKGRTGRHVEKWRQIVIEELARAFNDLLSLKPTKTKGGVFDRCLGEFMAAVSCTVDGRRITARRPSDTYPLIAKAIDAYPTKPINPLLTMEKWPGF